MENQLIQLYLLVCQIYDNQSSLKYQRRSNFKPHFSDQELMTVYLFGHLNGLYQKKAIHCFTRNYWADWFPALPSYQAFNRCLNLLEPAFHSIGRVLLNSFKGEQAAEIDHLIDSMPVMLASGSFSPRFERCSGCRQSRLLCGETPAFSRGSAAFRRFPKSRTTAVAENHLATRSVSSRFDECQRTTNLFAELNAFRRQGILRQGFGTGIQTAEHTAAGAKEETQGKELSCFEKEQNRLISKIRQPIESLFNWLIGKTQIQNASLVRSTNGLLVHCFGKLTFALLLLVFYY